MSLKVATFNVNGLRDVKKRRSIFNYLHDYDYDLVLLQETHSSVKDAKIWKAEWGGNIIFSHGETNSKGTAILIKKKANIQIEMVIPDQQGRFVIAVLKHFDSKFKVSSVYAPNQDKPEFFVSWFSKLEECEGSSILGGDFNTVLNRDKDLKGGRGYTHPKCTDLLNNYFEQNGLIDIWRIQHPEDFRSTWIKDHSTELRERIDFLVISNDLAQLTIFSDIAIGFKSDHAIPWIKIKSSHLPRSSGYWKFNVSLLEDPNFIEEVKQMIIDMDVNIDDIFTKWEGIKVGIRSLAIEYGIKKSNSMNLKLKKLEDKLKACMQDYENPSPNGSLFVDHIQQIELLKQDIALIRDYKTAGAMLKSKSEYFESGEKCTKYFFNMEKQKYSKRFIKRIEDEKGTIYDNLNDVNQCLFEFYSKLYASAPHELDMDFLSEIVFPQVKTRDKIMLDAPITMNEIHQAVQDLNLKKCPGQDGCPIEIYQAFWPQINDILYQLFREVIAQGILPKSTRQVILSLLDKPQKDLLKIINWRPLSLLNSDYKIFTKILANRLNKVLPYLVHEDQVGFIKGRSAADNLMDLNAIIHYTEINQTKAILFSNDFEKAYDKLEHDAIVEILRSYDFGEKFIEMLVIAHTQLEIKVSNAGHISEKSFPCTRSTLQGCPLSCAKFILVIEALALKIRQNPHIQGIKIGNKEKKVGLFADDLWAAFVATQNSYSEFLFELNEFGHFTGLKPNYNKTEIMRLGSLRKTNAKFISTLPLKWSDGPIKILGIHVTPDGEQMLTLNYDEILVKATNVLRAWQHRDLTPIGKIQLCNALVSSLAVYKLQTLPSPSNSWFDRYINLIREFIWGGTNRAKIRYRKLINDYKFGGLKLVDLRIKNTSLKLKWLLKFEDSKSLWKQHFIKLYMNSQPFSIDRSIKDLYKLAISVFRDVMIEWAKISFNKTDITTFNQVLKQGLWYNSLIKSNNMWLKSKEFYDVRISKVGDLIDLDTGEFYSWNEIKQTYELPDRLFISYHKVLASIPQQWKEILKQNLPSTEIVTFNEQFLAKNRTTSQIYSFLRDRYQENVQSTLKLLWEIDFGHDITEKRWEKSQLNAFKISNSVKMRYFQYRILNKKLVTNVHISKWIPDRTNLCTFCEGGPETVSHLFYFCSKVKKIWAALAKWIKYFAEVEIILKLDTIIFNDYKGPDKEMINTIILLTKHYIYIQRCVNEQLNFSKLITYINKIKNVEEFNAKKNNRLTKHKTKWCTFDEHF